MMNKMLMVFNRNKRMERKRQWEENTKARKRGWVNADSL